MNGTVADIQARADSLATENRPATTVIPLPTGNGREAQMPDDESPSLRLATLTEFVVKPSTTSWLVRGLLPAASIIVVFGPPKSGKTFSICDLVMHAAHGMHWHGHSVTRRLKVAVLAGEGTRHLRVRLYGWLQTHTPERDGEIRFLPQALSLPANLDDVVQLLRGFAPDLVVVDTLNAYFGGLDENSTQDMTRFLDAVRQIRDKVLTTVLLVHHTGLADASRERGSSVLRAAADAIIQVARDESGSGLVAFQLIDGRDVEAWDQPLGLRLRSIDTDWLDDDGEPMTTCVVETADQPVALPGRGGRPMGERQAELVSIARDLARTKTPEASGETLLLRSDVVQAAKAKGIGKTTVSAAWHPLARRGMWRLIEPGTVAVRVSR